MVLVETGDSARIDATVSSGQMFEVDSDLGNNSVTSVISLSIPIFSDGFESGDTSAWN